MFSWVWRIPAESRQFYSRLPTVTECESSELHDVLACVLLPARSTALHPHFEQTFTGCFDVASTKRQTKSATHGHSLRSMSRMRAYTNVLDASRKVKVWPVT